MKYNFLDKNKKDEYQKFRFDRIFSHDSTQE